MVVVVVVVEGAVVVVVVEGGMVVFACGDLLDGVGGDCVDGGCTGLACYFADHGGQCWSHRGRGSCRRSLATGWRAA